MEALEEEKEEGGCKFAQSAEEEEEVPETKRK